MSELKLGQVRSLINNTCRAIDIRAVALKAGSEWQCVVAVTRFTYRSPEKVREDQKEIKDRLGEVGGGRVLMLFDCLPISEFETLLINASQGRVSIAGYGLTLKSTSKDPLAERVLQYSNLITGDPDSSYPYYETMLLSESEPGKLLETAGVTGPSLGMPSLSDLQSWLGASVFGSTVAMVFVIPVYAQIYPPLYLKSAIIQAQFSAHQWLLNRCKKIGMLQLGYNQSPVQRRELALNDVALSDDIAAGTVSAPFTLDPTYRDARVQFQFLDAEFGILCKNEEPVTRMLSPTESPLYTSFSYFDAGKKMESYLLSPKGRQADSQFSSAVSWLLELCGFRVLNLSLLRDAEHLRVDGKEEGSCDILTVLESGSASSVLLIDCTTAVPEKQKLAKIRLTGEEVARRAADLFGKLNVTVRPVIAVSKDVPELRNPEYLSAQTYILDQSHLKILWDLVRAGNQGQALRTVCDHLSLAYPSS